MDKRQLVGAGIILMVSTLVLTGCEAGDTRFVEQDPAGFWYGLWHGVISFITLIIHIFNDSVKVYEVNNTGGWYDFGFLLGVSCIWGGGSHVSTKSAAQKQHDKAREKEWQEIGDKVEKKVMRRLKEWAQKDDGGNNSDAPEWDDISDQVEAKLKRKIREWAEKE